MYTGQEATVRTGHRTDWFQIGKEYIKAVCCHPAYLPYMQSTSWEAGLDEAQAGFKIGGRNINNLRYADDTTLTAESKELKSLLMKVKEESEKFGLKLNLRKLRSWHLVPSLHGKLKGKQWQWWQSFFWGGSKITADGDCSHEIKIHLLLGRKVLTQAAY